MSIKTLRKRIALVAVSALGVSVMSLATAPVANAATMTGTASSAVYNWGESVSDANHDSGDVGFCSENDTTDVLVVRYPSANTTWKLTASNTSDDLAGDRYAFITASGGSGYWSTSDFTANTAEEGFDKSGDERTLTIGETSGSQTTLDVPDELAWVATGTGTVTFNLYTVLIATGASTLMETYTLIVGANCDAAGAYSGTYSGTALRAVSTALDASTYDDGDTSSAVSVEYATGVSYLGHWLRDAYGEAVTDTSSFLNVTAAGGCTISATTTDLSSTATTVNVTSTITSAVIKVFTNSKKQNTCTLTSSYNGTEVSKKTVTFKGETATIETSNKDAAITAAATNAMSWTAKDDKGSALGSISATLTDLTGSLIGATFTISNSSSTAAADVTIDAVDTAYGDGTFRIRTTLADGSYVYSPVQTVKVTSSTKAKYSMSLDKASYAPGEIIVVTISATDSLGSIVADGTTLSTSGNLTFTIAGAEALSAAPAHGDLSSGGKWVYRYTAKTVEGGWAANISLGDVTTDEAKQATYQIKSTSTSVTNAEVLAAIVKLIASINKQIRALQRQLGR